MSIFFIGLFYQGMGLFSSFFPVKVPFYLAPFLMFVELISYTVRLASLALRLFANIVAGHILLDTISLFIYYGSVSIQASTGSSSILAAFSLLFLLLVVLSFELLISFLQAYIFVVLVIIYMNDSINLHI